MEYNTNIYAMRMSAPAVLQLQQGSNAIPMFFKFCDYVIPNGAETRLYVRKPSSLEVYVMGTIERNGAIFETTTQMTAEDGRCEGQIQIIKDSKILNSFLIYLDVAKSIISDSAIESKDEFGILDTLINQAREEIKNAQNATSAANTAAESATTAANAANTGAEAATSAAESATTAADAANAGAEAATSAATSANAAADRANEAAGNIEQANIKPLAYSVSGESITAGNSAEKPLIGLTVHGHAYQVSTTGAQLFNKSSVTSESYVRDTDGTVVASTTRPTYASDYITLDGAESIYITSTMTSNRWGAFYNDKKEYVSGIAGYSSPITVPVGAVYIRLTVADDNLDTFMVNTGSTALPYEPYTGGAPSPSVEYPQAIDIAGLGWATGAQLWDAGDVIGTLGTTYTQADLSAPIQPGTYTMTADVASSDTDSDTCLLYDLTNSVSLGQLSRGMGKSVTFTTSKTIQKFCFYNGKDYTASVDDTSSFKNIMLNTGSSALPWEPYTGGKQEYYEKGIKVESTGKNLFSLDDDIVFTKTICDIDKKTNEIALTATASSATSTSFCQYVSFLSEKVTKHFRGKTITVSAKYETNNSNLSPVIFVNMYDSDNKVIGDEQSIYFKQRSSITVIVPNETDKIRVIFRVDQLKGQAIGDFVRMYDIQVEIGSTVTAYEPYKTQQPVTISPPNGLPGLKVSSGGNYTDASGQQWICDEIVRNERGTGKRIQRIGIIESYASETINTAYMSTTGQLTEGATVLYVLDDVIETDLSDEEIAALSALHTYSPTTTISNDAGCDMTAAYVTQYYQGVGDAMFYGVADNLTTEASGTSVLDAHQGKILKGLLDDIWKTIYPVGSIYMSVNNTDPGTLFGGTWEAWGTGRVPVGVDSDDSDFDTTEKTGGKKQVSQFAWIGAVNSQTTALAYAVATPSDEAMNKLLPLYNGYGVTGSTPGSITRLNHATYVTDADGDSTRVLQPYITCYMWKRTA